MRIDMEKHTVQCIPCAQTEGNTQTAFILEYPLHDGPFDVAGIDLLQLSRCSQGFVYILVSVDHFSRFAILASLPNKSAVTDSCHCFSSDLSSHDSSSPSQ